MACHIFWSHFFTFGTNTTLWNSTWQLKLHLLHDPHFHLLHVVLLECWLTQCVLLTPLSCTPHHTHATTTHHFMRNKTCILYGWIVLFVLQNLLLWWCTFLLAFGHSLLFLTLIFLWNFHAEWQGLLRTYTLYTLWGGCLKLYSTTFVGVGARIFRLQVLTIFSKLK